MSSEGYHEPVDLLSEETKNLHRGIVSLIEELEAVDWYNQRAEACTDADLKAVLIHHRNEEIEHAMMNLEWLRRRDPAFDANMRTYLFKAADITKIEEEETGGRDERGTIEGDGGGKDHGGGAPAGRGASPSLNVGSLREI